MLIESMPRWYKYKCGVASFFSSYEVYTSSMMDPPR